MWVKSFTYDARTEMRGCRRREETYLKLLRSKWRQRTGEIGETAPRGGATL